MENHRRERALYGAVLRAYPPDFRARFGMEMIDAFSEEIREQREQYGLRGVLSAWWSALWEVVSVAGPLQLQGSLAPALVLSILVSSVFTLGFFAAVTPHCVK